MRPTAIVLMLLFLCGCAVHKAPGFYGGDGSSMDQAVEIVGYQYSSYLWISEHYPGAEILFQELAIHPISGRRYDVITFKTVEGETRKVYFLLSGGPGSVRG